jgi:Circularly permutated YpsA SLOG family
VSGGQTGVDRAALDVARERGLACGGWCPRGRRAEDGVIPERYSLKETPSSDYSERTEWNVRDSDATLVLTWGPPTGGTAYTVERAVFWARPLLLLDLSGRPRPSPVREWLRREGVRVLNVAGPRESGRPGVYAKARGLLESAFTDATAGPGSSARPGPRPASA